jgi:hypothetical protein
MALTDAGWPKFIYFIWSEIGWLFFNLMLWGVAGRLLNVRQAKRLFGLIGELFAALDEAGGGSKSRAAGQSPGWHAQALQETADRVRDGREGIRDSEDAKGELRRRMK